MNEVESKKPGLLWEIKEFIGEIKSNYYFSDFASKLRFKKFNQEITQRSKTSFDWKTCTEPSLRGHIVNAHFHPRNLKEFGIARFDLELCEYRGVNLDWVVKKAIERIEGPNPLFVTDLEPNKKYYEHPHILTPLEYRTGIIKNLRYMDELKLVDIDWKRIEKAFPETMHIGFNLRKDSHEPSFYDILLAKP